MATKVGVVDDVLQFHSACIHKVCNLSSKTSFEDRVLVFSPTSSMKHIMEILTLYLYSCSLVDALLTSSSTIFSR